jgi:hypothetical protein
MTKRALPEDHKGYGKLILFVVYKVPALVVAVGLALRMCHGTHLSACQDNSIVLGNHLATPSAFPQSTMPPNWRFVDAALLSLYPSCAFSHICPCVFAPLRSSTRGGVCSHVKMGSCMRRRLETARLGLGGPRLQLHCHTAHGLRAPRFRSVHRHRLAVYCYGAQAHSTAHKHALRRANPTLFSSRLAGIDADSPLPAKAIPTLDVPGSG